MSADDQRAAEPPHRRDVRLWLDRHADEEQVIIHVGRTGYGTMDVAGLRAELDRDAAELAETRAAAADTDELREEAFREIQAGYQVALNAGATVDSLQPLRNALGALNRMRNRWRSVRGDAPAPAEPPAAGLPYAWGGGDGGRYFPTVEAPAVELPVTLSSPADVAAVCLAHGLTAADSGIAWYDRTGRVNVHLLDGTSSHVNVGGPGAYVGIRIEQGAPSSLLLAAIEAARGGSR